MDKYYTPELEEFYTGFEYETCNFKNKIWIKKITDMNIISLTSCIYDENPELFKNEYRVKYLDKEDIESLGFIITKDNEEVELSLESKRYIGGPSVGDDYKIIILYGLDNKEMWIYKKCNNGYEDDLFKGLIKNKSELIKLLKQLQIG